jgi:hypothetical protein
LKKDYDVPEKALKLSKNALAKIRSAMLPGKSPDWIKKQMKKILEEGEASKKKQTEQSDASLTEVELIAVKAADTLKSRLRSMIDVYREYTFFEREGKRELYFREETKKLVSAIKHTEDGTTLQRYKRIQYFHQLGMNAPEKVLTQEDRYIKAFEKLFERICPRILQEYKKRGVEFVLRREHAEEFWPLVKNKNGKWQLEIPIPFEYGPHQLTMRLIDNINQVRLLQDGEIPSREQRVDTIIHVAMANTLLGRHSASIAGYPTLQMIDENFANFIYSGLKTRTIDRKKMSLHQILEKGYEAVKKWYTDYIQENDLYPSMQPGAFFGEGTEYKINQGQEPAILGTDEYKAMAERTAARIKMKVNSAYTVNMRLLGEDLHRIYLQPYYVVKGLQSRHPLNVAGGDSIYAGETNLAAKINEETGKIDVLRTKDQSGHFMPYDKDDPGRAIYRALKIFEEQGYDTSTTMVELTAIEGANVLPYHNYTPPHFLDLRQQDWLTDSERYILKHGKDDMIEEVKKRRDNRIEAYNKLNEQELNELSKKERKAVFDLRNKDWLTDGERHILEHGKHRFLKNAVKKRRDNRIEAYNKLNEQELNELNEQELNELNEQAINESDEENQAPNESDEENHDDLYD